MERQPAQPAILRSRESVSHLQPALHRTLGPHPHPHHEDGHICSRSLRLQPQERFQHEDPSLRQQRRRRRGHRRDFWQATPHKPRDHCLLKWLIYTASIQGFIRGKARGANVKFYLDWKWTIAAKEDVFRQKLLEALQIWYARFQASKKCNCSLLATGPRDSVELSKVDC